MGKWEAALRRVTELTMADGKEVEARLYDLNGRIRVKSSTLVPSVRWWRGALPIIRITFRDRGVMAGLRAVFRCAVMPFAHAWSLGWADQVYIVCRENNSLAIPANDGKIGYKFILLAKTDPEEALDELLEVLNSDD